MSRLSVAIVQEYVPRYRLRFFSELVERLDARGIACVVVAGLPVGSQAERADATGGLPWLKLAGPHRFALGSRSVSFYGTPKHWRDCDAVIMELRGNSLDLNVELLTKKLTGRRVGVWGHVKPYIQPGHPIDLAVERRQMIRSDRVFAYTRTGADFAIAAGADPNRVTAVMNSTDVADLLAVRRTINIGDVHEFEARNSLTSGKAFAYIGGIDASKRIEFLVSVLDILWKNDREIKLVVGGRGDQEGLLAPAAERGQVVLLGFVGPAEKSLLSVSCEALLNPGRVGLVAVECMALGFPILTTDWKFHAPEYEYLTQGDDVHVSSNSVADYAELVLSRVRHSEPGSRPLVQPERDYPTLSQMVDNFAAGVEALVG